MKLLGLLLIHCVFTKKTEGAKKGRKFVKIGTGKNIGSPEQCALGQKIETPEVALKMYLLIIIGTISFQSTFTLNNENQQNVTQFQKVIIIAEILAITPITQTHLKVK